MSDRYQIISVIGSSRAGTIHRGWDKHQNRDVSIQRIKAEGEAAQEVLREARALYGLRHPNVVTVYEYGDDADGVYVVREAIKGKPLADIVAQRRLSSEEFDILVHQTLSALDEAHTRSLIHRNLQPGALMVPWNARNEFNIKITDFTLAAPADPEVPPPLESEHFMAPEQFGNSPVTLRADLYSLGAIFYYGLTQQHAFKGEHSSEVVVAHLYHRFTPLQELRPDLSKPLCAWVERLMLPNAAERPASAEEALQMFRLIPEDEVVLVAPIVEEEEPALLPLLEEDEEVPPLAPAPAEPEYEAPAEPTAEPEPEPEPLPPAQAYFEPKPEPEPLIRPAIAVAAPEPPRAPFAPAKAPPRRSSALNLIVMAFAAILVGMLILISVLKFSSQGDREKRLAELSASENPQGSDLDVRMLLDFLEERDHRETAATALAKLQGGAYIDTMLADRLGETGAHSAAITLVEVIGRRGSQSAFAKVLPFTHDRSRDMRKAAWTTLGKIAGTADLPRLIQAVDASSADDEDLIKDNLVAAIERAADRDAANKAALEGYRSAKDAATRAILLNVMTRVGGGPETLALITSAISDPAEDVRRAAIIVLAKYPTHDPLTAITARFPEETDSSCRAYLLLAAKEIVSKPGASSQELLARQVQSLYANAKTDAEKDRALSAISQVIAPSTATFYETYAEQDDPRLRREALALSAAYTRRLAKVVSVAPGAVPTQVPAAQADYALGGAITLENDVLTNWTQEADWASWLIEFPQNGDYEVVIYQAHAADATGTYEVLLAGQTKLTASVKTGGADDFKGFVVGQFTIAEPGTYKLLIRPKKIPANGELFRVQKLAVKPL